jgi:catechol 2,3-dioxygenase-like lactoylglutathione lyase family enzyme
VIQLDHVIYATSDLDAAADWFRTEFGLIANREVGQHPGGTANRCIAVGGTQYIELLTPQGDGAIGDWVRRRIADGDRWLMWAVTTDELEFESARLGLEISKGRVTHKNGTVGTWRSAGSTHRDVTQGRLPFWLCYDDPDRTRPEVWARRLAEASGATPLEGMAWLEVGISPHELERWLGSNASIPVKAVNSGHSGLLRVAVATSEREIVIS